MTAQAIRAEITKLARLVGAPEAQLEFLSSIPVPALRKYREAVQDQMFMAGRSLFQRLAMAGKLLPAALNAMLSEKVFGAVLSAGISNEFEPQRAVDVAAKLSIPFLTEVSLNLDPKRAKEIVRRMPVATVVGVSRELAKRREFISMARFVDTVTEEALNAVIADASEEVLLRSSFFVENPARVSQIMLSLPEARLKKLLQTADSDALREDALELFSQLPAEGQNKLLKLAQSLGLERLAVKS